MLFASHPIPPRTWANPAASITIITLLLWLIPAASWIVPQPRTNVWVTLAKAVNQDHLCMSMASAEDPMSTCLVGIPFSPQDMPSSLLDYRNKYNTWYPLRQPESRRLPPLPQAPVLDPLALWQEWAETLHKARGEPQELELLGSAPAQKCVHFDYFPIHHPNSYHYVRQEVFEYQTIRWCTNVTRTRSPPMERPRQLPKGVFLICGDRAWAGIPSRLLGGPCTLGQLGLFSPNQTQILNWKIKNSSSLAVQKRSLQQLDPNCSSDIIHWSKSKRVAVSVFLPWVAAAKALGELGRLECWVAKQANLTSAALSDLLADEETTRKATLQNRAAIDFLLLAHGHGCQDFAGLCCFNLSSRSESVHSKIQQIHDAISTIKQESGDWLANTFKN